MASWGGFEDYYTCNAIFDVPVPVTDFYAFYTGDRSIRTVSADAFPLDFGIAIDLENGT